MAQGWRGFGKERHSALKAGLAAIALAAFAGGWLGFANSHPPLEDATSETTPTAVAPSAIPPTGTPAAAATTSATPVIAANPTEPLPTYPRPKRSRGS